MGAVSTLDWLILLVTVGLTVSNAVWIWQVRRDRRIRKVRSKRRLTNLSPTHTSQARADADDEYELRRLRMRKGRPW